MTKTLNVRLAIVVDTELDKAGNIVNNLIFDAYPDSEIVEVKYTEVVDFFEVF